MKFLILLLSLIGCAPEIKYKQCKDWSAEDSVIRYYDNKIISEHAIACNEWEWIED